MPPLKWGCQPGPAVWVGRSAAARASAPTCGKAPSLWGSRPSGHVDTAAEGVSENRPSPEDRSSWMEAEAKCGRRGGGALAPENVQARLTGRDP